jgi:hypothetical protein
MHSAVAEIIEPRLFLSLPAEAVSGDVDFGSVPGGGRSATVVTVGGPG